MSIRIIRASRWRSKRRVSITARKKVVFVIVEGESDNTALAAALENVFDKESVFVHIYHGDITSEKGVGVSNIVSRVGSLVKGYASENFLHKADFLEVIHITDTDGTYIPPEAVLCDETARVPHYSLCAINTADKHGIEERNRRKSANINRLCACGEVWKVPYRMYYMSCNLDHVLYDKQNSTDADKRRDSYAFAKKYCDDKSAFLKFMRNSSFAVRGDYAASWDFIKKDLNSLNRYSNLTICLEEK